MNALSKQKSLSVYVDAIVDAITCACKPVLAQCEGGEHPNAPMSGIGRLTALHEALKTVGFPDQPASALAIHDLLLSLSETGSFTDDTCETFDSLQAAIWFLRSKVGYEGDVKTKADTLARIKILMMDIEDDAIDPDFMRLTLHELWGDIQSMHGQPKRAVNSA